MAIRQVGFGDTASTDAFGRLRTSSPGERLDVEFIYNKQVDFFDEVTTNGTVTHNANTRDLTLSLSDANNGSQAKMASHPVPYTPGDGHLIELTAVLNDADLSGGTAELFLRTSISGSATETVIPQSQWFANRDTMDWSDSHIFTIDFQSLKVGRLRYSFNQDGDDVRVWEIRNDNLRDSGYWQTPSLPAYYRLYTTGGFTYAEVGYGDENNAAGFRFKVAANASATMRAICCTVKSEAGRALRDMPGIPRATNMGVTAKTVSTTRVPVLSIRSLATFNSLPNLGLLIPKGLTVQASEAVRIDVISGGALTNASWADVSTNGSCAEVDTAATAITGGEVIASRYLYATTSGPASAQFVAAAEGLLGKAVLWDRKGSETGILTIAAVRTGGTDASVLASMDWEELR